MRVLLGVLLALSLCLPAKAEERFITLASTTSTQNSGLYDYILPRFTAKTGIGVRVVAVGTGQAMRLARNGDADVLLVHHRPSEDAFVAEGFGVERFGVMYNDFVLVGPKSDPVDIRKSANIEIAMLKLAKGFFPFISRGDESGTHKREMELWANAGLNELSGRWYRSIGSGMGAALNMASAVDAYTLSDRGTWLSFANKGDLQILFSGDENLRNPYGIIVVSAEKHPHIKTELANEFVSWILSAEGQTAIGEMTVNGLQLFCPNAKKSNSRSSPKAKCPAQ